MLLIRKMWLDMKGVIRAARKIINAQLEPFGLTGTEGDLLFLLVTGSDNLQQEQLAEQLDIGKAVVSRAVDSLVFKGYVSRTRSNTDRRAYTINLTDKALKISKSITEVYDNLYSLARKGIADDDFINIETLLSRISKNLQNCGECND
ncbi:MAG: MarR family transcriptional regulator [Clostridiaceae bacterium]|nr:MarR family transcriptional regulator [Clostridiaceae bacterium]